MQLTEHQIKGSKLLADVEGFKWELLSNSGLMDNFRGEIRNYLNDWNDLHRCWQVFRDKDIAMHRYPSFMHIEYGFITNDKELVFSALVEAAKWIKQQEK